jgi:predicted small secreted protein
MRRLLLAATPLLALLAAAPLLAACHTMEGAGQDISATGHTLSNSAEQHTP